MADKSVLIKNIYKISGIGICAFVELLHPMSLRKGDILYNLRLDPCEVTIIGHPHYDTFYLDTMETNEKQFMLRLTFPEYSHSPVEMAESLERFKDGTVIFSQSKAWQIRRDVYQFCGDTLSDYLLFPTRSAIFI